MFCRGSELHVQFNFIHTCSANNRFQKYDRVQLELPDPCILLHLFPNSPLTIFYSIFHLIRLTDRLTGGAAVAQCAPPATSVGEFTVVQEVRKEGRREGRMEEVRAHSFLYLFTKVEMMLCASIWKPCLQSYYFSDAKIYFPGKRLS